MLSDFGCSTAFDQYHIKSARVPHVLGFPSVGAGGLGGRSKGANPATAH